MKNFIVFLVLVVVVLNAWFVMEKSYWCNNLFLSTPEIGVCPAIDFDCYYSTAKDMAAVKPVYIGRPGSRTYPPTFYYYFSLLVGYSKLDIYAIMTIAKIPTLLFIGWAFSSILFGKSAGAFRRILASVSIALLLYIFTPSQDDIMYGQINLFVLAGLALALYFALNEKPELCGIVLGLIFSAKLITAFLILYYLVVRKWKISIPAIITIGVLNIPVLWKYGAKIYADYFHYFMASRLAIANFQNISFFSVLIKEVKNPLIVGPWVLALNVLLLVFVFWLLMDKKKPDEAGTFSILIMLAMMISPIMWSYHLVWLFIPFVYVLNKILSGENIIMNSLGLVFVYFPLSFLCGMAGDVNMVGVRNVFLKSHAPLLLMIILFELIIYNLKKPKYF